MWSAARIFVGSLFALIGIAFVVPAVVLIYEFSAIDWQTLLFAHSHLFFFFPVFGILALVAFYQPAVAFTHFYWEYVKFGKARYAFGFLVVAAAALWFGSSLNKAPLRGIWEVSPRVLQSEMQTRASGQQHEPFLGALKRVREEGQQRSSIAELLRICKIDQLVERSLADKAERYCFPAGKSLTTDDCCRVQGRFSEALYAAASDPARRSILAQVEAGATYLKSFFIIIIFIIGALLVVWQRRIKDHYPEAQVESIENGVIVGAVAMVLWFLMDYGYQQTSDLLFGRQQTGFPIRLSFVIVPWAVLLVLYFTKSERGKETQLNPGQLLIALASNIAAVQYDKIANLSFRLLGAGAEWKIFALLVFISLLMLFVILFPNFLPSVFGQLEEKSSKEKPPIT